MRKTLEQFKQELYNVWGDRYTVSPNAVYVNTHTKIEIICKQHGSFMIEPNLILRGFGCKECRRETVNKDKVLSQEEVIERLKKVWGDKYDLSAVKYVNARTKITPICRMHGLFRTRFSDFENLHGCPLCRQSRLETEISKFLNDNSIKFEREYKCEWLKFKNGCLKFDFYLPDYNTAIECQGKQHYDVNSMFRKDGESEKIEERDMRKLSLCNEHNVKLLYYTEKSMKSKIPEEYKSLTYFDKSKLLEEIKKAVI